ncbi:MAG: hypothetical protein ACP6IY_14585 [Promethearchaeia archaeon]
MIEEFWILHNSGICLFHKSIHLSQDFENISLIEYKQLFGGLLSGILKAYSQIAADNIQKLESKEGKFLFFTKHSLIFIVRAKINASDKKIKKKMEIIQKLFIEKYDEKLKNFDGEITSFKLFKKDLDEIFNKLTKVDKWGKSLINL